MIFKAYILLNRFQSDKGLQFHHNTKHHWHQRHTDKQNERTENWAKTTGYPQYTLQVAEVVQNSNTSSSTSQLDLGPNDEEFEVVETNAKDTSG